MNWEFPVGRVMFWVSQSSCGEYPFFRVNIRVENENRIYGKSYFSPEGDCYIPLENTKWCKKIWNSGNISTNWNPDCRGRIQSWMEIGQWFYYYDGGPAKNLLGSFCAGIRKWHMGLFYDIKILLKRNFGIKWSALMNGLENYFAFDGVQKLNKGTSKRGVMERGLTYYVSGKRNPRELIIWKSGRDVDFSNQRKWQEKHPKESWLRDEKKVHGDTTIHQEG